MQENLTPGGDEQELVTLHDGTEVSADTPTQELDSDYYGSDQYATDDEAIETYTGDYVLVGDSKTFTHGKHEGEHFHENDGNVVELLGDGYCHADDNYSTTGDGDNFWPGEEDDHDLVWAKDEDEWYPKDDCDYCVVGRSSRYGRAEWGYVRHGDTVYCESDCNRYWDSVLGDFDIEEDGDSGDYYFADDLPSRSEADNAGYHDLERRNRTTPATRFTVGFEIEKEDSDACTIGYQYLYDTTGWVKEHDSSLDDDCGYELVTPVYDLMTDDLDKAIAASYDLRRLIDGEQSDNCGGHINFGIVGQSGQQVCDLAAGWFPLIYAMFPARARGGYSTMKKLDHTKTSCEKFQAVAVWSNRIEFRVFSAVRNRAHLLWRRDFLRLLAQNLSADPTQVLSWVLDSDHPLHRHLRKVYTEPKLLELVGRAVDFHHELEELRLGLTVAFTPKPQLALAFVEPVVIPATLASA